MLVFIHTIVNVNEEKKNFLIYMKAWFISSVFIIKASCDIQSIGNGRLVLVPATGCTAMQIMMNFSNMASQPSP